MLPGLVCAVALASFAAGRPSLPPERQSALVLFAEDPSQPATQALETGLQQAIASAGPDAPVLYFEYIDGARFESPTYRAALRRYIADKYEGRDVDLVVPIGQSAIQFVADTRDDLWPNATPLLYVATHMMTIDARATLPGAAGLDFAYDFSAALPPVTALLPGTRRIAMISGASALERARTAGTRDAVLRAGLAFVDMNGLTVDQVLAQVATLPAHTVVFIGGPLVDASGRATPPATLCAMISAASNCPTFMAAATQFVGCGIVGGRMRDFAAMGELAGRRILEHLAGGAADVRRPAMPDFTSVIFDARQLERWGIDEGRVPAGSVVQFRRPSVWRDYRREMLTVLGGLTVQSLLIVGLMYERRHRMRAERDSRRHLGIAAHAGRRAAVATLTGSIAHELSQPLGAILLNTAAAKRLIDVGAATPAQLSEILDDIARDDTRASQIVHKHREMLKHQEIEKRAFDVFAAARDSVRLLAHEAQGRQVTVDVQLPATPCIVQGDRVLLQQVLVNLLMNAMDAIEAAAPPRRSIRLGAHVQRDTVEILVSDSGPGLPADLMDQVFEPFVTTKAGGLGIGLSIARSVIAAHGGTIDARNAAGGGAEFIVAMPRDAASLGAEDPYLLIQPAPREVS